MEGMNGISATYVRIRALFMTYVIFSTIRVTEARLSCPMYVSNCTLDERCNGMPYGAGDTDVANSLRIDCRILHEDDILDLDIIKPISNLKELYVNRVAVPPLTHFGRLTQFEIWKGTLHQNMQNVVECENLEVFGIFESRVDGLPDGWLSNCTKLRSVMIEYTEGIHKLPERLLEKATELRSLSCMGLDLHQLPSDLISNTPKLQTLDLSHNYLQELPKGFFKNTPYLNKLRLITKESKFDAQEELYSLTDLNFLMLDSAHKYGQCRDDVLRNGTYKTVPFHTLPKLEYLSLEWTEAKRICPEWTELFPSLKKLDLRDNRISTLKYKDVELIRNNGWTVDLSTSSTKSTFMEAIEFTENEYKAALESKGNSAAKIEINKYFGLMCTCRWYWMIRTLKEKPGYISLEDAGCWWADPPGSWNRKGAPFAQVPLEKLYC